MTDLDTALRAGLAWLFDTVQPDGAVLQHHGWTLPAGPGFKLTFVPYGFRCGPVVVLDKAAAGWDGLAGRFADPITTADMGDVAAQILAAGRRVSFIWNGAGHNTGSFGLAGEAHPTLLAAAVGRYLAGCQDHKRTVHLVGVGAVTEGDVFCRCGWYQTGHALVVPPQVEPAAT